MADATKTISTNKSMKAAYCLKINKTDKFHIKRKIPILETRDENGHCS